MEDLDPETGERVWHFCTAADVSVETLHVQLVILAWRQEFPVESDDGKLAIAFIERLVRQTARSCSPEDIEEFTAECLDHLIRSFHTPSSSLSLPTYVRRYVKAMIASKGRVQAYESFQLANGPVYSVPQARMRMQSEMQHAFDSEFMDIWVPSERTIYDWIKAEKIGTQKIEDGSVAITEEGLQTAIALARTHADALSRSARREGFRASVLSKSYTDIGRPMEARIGHSSTKRSTPRNAAGRGREQGSRRPGVKPTFARRLSLCACDHCQQLGCA